MHINTGIQLEVVVVFDRNRDGTMKVCSDGTYRCEIRLVSGDKVMRVYSWRTNQELTKLIQPMTEKNGNRFRNADITPELQEEILSILRVGESKSQGYDNYDDMDEETKRHMEETKRLQDEHYKKLAERKSKLQ